MQLSKSDYLLYLKHPCWLWLKKNDKSKLPPVDENTQAIFDAGFLFERFAEKLFPQGVKLGFDNYQEYLSLPKRTKEAIGAGAKTIFQGRFEANDITCICDVVDFVDDNTVDVYEIKSSTAPKILHEYDLAFQKLVLVGAGYRVRKLFVICVNKDFVRNGKIEPKDITMTADVTTKVEKRISAVKEDIKLAMELVAKKEMPNPTPAFCKHGATAEWTAIYKNLMDIKEGDGSIYDLYFPNSGLVLALEDMGIQNLLDIPQNLGALSQKQKWQLKAAREDKVFVDEKKIKKFLESFEFPLYFLDYETLSSVVPYFDGHRPYQQVPFQYSLHVLESLESEPKHFMYLHKSNTDPVPELTESLKQNIGTSGSVVVWNQSFEMGCNEDMGKMYPQYADFYKSVNSRVVDLMKPFFDFWYVDKRFGGSASIKSVLPVLVPELSYKELNIAEGGAAQRLWMEAVLDGKREGEKQKILNDLEAYCELDTLAMVKIWEFLHGIALPQKPATQLSLIQ